MYQVFCYFLGFTRKAGVSGRTQSQTLGRSGLLFMDIHRGVESYVVPSLQPEAIHNSCIFNLMVYFEMGLVQLYTITQRYKFLCLGMQWSPSYDDVGVLTPFCEVAAVRTTVATERSSGVVM